MQAEPIELYDSDILVIEKIWDKLRERHQQQRRNYPAFEQEVRERFAEAGFLIHVNWFGYEIGGERQEGAMPEITVTGRTEKQEFDHDKQVHEVTGNILELPGQEAGEVIRTDRGDAFKTFREEHGNAHSHGGHAHNHGGHTHTH